MFPLIPLIPGFATKYVPFTHRTATSPGTSLLPSCQVT
jgi:hypothetical protein